MVGKAALAEASFWAISILQLLHRANVAIMVATSGPDERSELIRRVDFLTDIDEVVSREDRCAVVKPFPGDVVRMPMILSSL